MKYLKYPLFILAGLIGIYLILCLLGPKDLDVSASIEVESPPLIIYNMVNNLKNGELWNDWVISDTTLSTSYNKVSEGVGASSEWQSKSQGGGSQQIIESSKPSFVKTQLRFEGWEGTNRASFFIEPQGKKSYVNWTFESGKPFAFLTRGAFLLTGMKKEMKKAYQAGLKNIKRIAEERANQGLYFGYTIKEEVIGERNFVMRRDIVEKQNMQQFYATQLGSLFNMVQRAKIQMDGMPCGLFFKVDEQSASADMAAAIPVSDPVEIKGAGSFRIESKKALVTDHYGDYSKLPRVHQAIETYMKDRGYLYDPPFIEEYVTDPEQEEDPNKILTRVTFYYTK